MSIIPAQEPDENLGENLGRNGGVGMRLHFHTNLTVTLKASPGQPVQLPGGVADLAKQVDRSTAEVLCLVSFRGTS